MESKNSESVTVMNDMNDVNDAEKVSNKNLIIRFVEYAFNILNNEMNEFFEEKMLKFDQNLNELQDGSGETLEQYEIYQEYLQLLEIKFDKFINEEGYKNSTECFDEMNELIVNDEIERKKIFKELSEKMMKAFENFQQQIQEDSGEGGGDQGEDDEKGEKDGDDEEDDVKGSEKKGSDMKRNGRKIKDSKESKGDDDDDDEADAKHQQVHASPAPPVMMFFQPVSLDSMLQHVLSLTEYTTFSTIIRTKLKQKQLYLSLQDRVSIQSKNTSRRQRSLDQNQHFEEIYEELIQRICNFASNQTHFQNQIRSHLNINSWNELLAAGQ